MKQLNYNTKENLSRFSETTETIEYKNPYTYKNSNGTILNRPNIVLSNSLLFKVIVDGNVGMLVYRFNRYDYVVNNILVSQRVGASIELLKEFTRRNIRPSDYSLAHQIIKELASKQTDSV